MFDVLDSQHEWRSRNFRIRHQGGPILIESVPAPRSPGRVLLRPASHRSRVLQGSIIASRLRALNRRQPAVQIQINRIVHEADATVGHAEIRAAGVTAHEGVVVRPVAFHRHLQVGLLLVIERNGAGRRRGVEPGDHDL